MSLPAWSDRVLAGRTRCVAVCSVPTGVVVLASALMAGVAACAAEGLGFIEARLGDRQMDWHTIARQHTSGTVASASITLGPRLTEISIQGHPEAQFTSRDTFSIDMRYLGPHAPEKGPMSVDILDMPDGLGGPF